MTKGWVRLSVSHWCRPISFNNPEVIESAVCNLCKHFSHFLEQKLITKIDKQTAFWSFLISMIIICTFLGGKYPFGQVPILEVEPKGVTISQSMSILRFLAERYGTIDYCHYLYM